jgi:hypothetical protein
MRLSPWILSLTLLPSAAFAAEGKKPKAAKPHSHKAAEAPAREDRRADLFGGVSHAKSGDATVNGPELSVSFPFRRRVRLAVDLAHESGMFGIADYKETSLLVGPGLVWRHGKLLPFARLMVGAVRQSVDVDGFGESASHLGLALAGGTDYRLGHQWAVRGQAGLWFVHGDGGWDTNLHLALGAVYRFKI